MGSDKDEGRARRSPTEWAHDTVDALQGHGSTIWLTSSAVFGGLSALEPVRVLMLLAAVISAIVGIVLAVKLDPSYAGMVKAADAARSDRERTAQAMQDLVRWLLIEACRQGAFAEVHQRASVYVHAGGEFVMVARWSRNADLSRPGRGVYPDNCGVIARAWQSREFYAREWPEDLDDWIEVQASFGVAESVARDLRMRSRSIAAWRIDDVDHRPVGVVVTESEQPRGVRLSTTNALQEASCYASLCRAIESSAPVASTVAAAAVAMASGRERAEVGAPAA